MRGSSFDRRSRRRSVYYVVMFFGVTILGIVLLVSLLAAGKQHVHSHLYRDPVQTLLHTFAETETRFAMKTQRFASLDELVREDMVSEEFAAGPVEGYRYKIQKATPAGFAVTAEPEGPAPSPEPTEPGKPPAVVRPRKFYFVDETHTIRYEETRPAGPESPIIWSPRDAWR